MISHTVLDAFSRGGRTGIRKWANIWGRCFQEGDYIRAEGFYTKAYVYYASSLPSGALGLCIPHRIIHDSTNPAYFTNRALSRLKLSLWETVITDCHRALDLLPTSLKAYTYLGQAQLALDRPNEALSSSRQAYKLAIAQNSRSAATIAGTVLQAKKRRWEVSEERRILEQNSLLNNMVEMLKEEGERQVMQVEKQWNLGNMKGCGKNTSKNQELGEAVREEIEARRHATQQKIHLIKDVFAKTDPTLYKPRVCFSGPNPHLSQMLTFSLFPYQDCPRLSHWQYHVLLYAWPSYYEKRT